MVAQWAWKSNTTPFFFNSEDSYSLSHAITNLVNDNELIKRIIDNAYDLMSEKYNWTKIGKQTYDAYNKISYFYKK